MDQEAAATAAGIHVQTLSKYERGAIKKVPIDVLITLAAVYNVDLDSWLSRMSESLSQSVSRGTSEGVLREEGKRYGTSARSDEDSWSPNPALVNKIPKRAYDVAVAYCRRLQSAGWPTEEIEQIERLMIDPRYAQANKRKGLELTEDEFIMLIDATWEAVKHSAAAMGRQV